MGNLVRYAPGTVEVQVDWNRGNPVLHVIDNGPGFQFAPRLPRDIYSESGRGLYLVSSLAEDFHVTRRGRSRGSHARVVLYSTTTVRARKAPDLSRLQAVGVPQLAD